MCTRVCVYMFMLFINSFICLSQRIVPHRITLYVAHQHLEPSPAMRSGLECRTPSTHSDARQAIGKVMFIYLVTLK